MPEQGGDGETAFMLKFWLCFTVGLVVVLSLYRGLTSPHSPNRPRRSPHHHPIATTSPPTRRSKKKAAPERSSFKKTQTEGLTNDPHPHID